MQILTDQALHDIQPMLDDVVIVDIREPDEYAREHIVSSINLPLSKWDKHSFERYKDKIVMVHCLAGTRTQSARAQLSKIPCKELLCLSGGIKQWKSCGYPTRFNKERPIEIMRQVQIIVGAMVLLGILLSNTISPYFIAISLFFAAGLLFAGVTGYCGMAKLLAYLPYNRIDKESL
jgi:rhodanese-related sulfurtransferase